MTLVLMLGPSDSYITASRYSTVYFSLSVGTTMVLTLAIVVRLLIARRRVSKVMNCNIPEYLSASTMLVESAFIYSVFAIPHAILNAMNNPAQLLTFHIVGQVQVRSCYAATPARSHHGVWQSIAPLLIVFRVAQKRAWSRAVGIEAESLANCTWNLPPIARTHRAPSMAISLDTISTNVHDDGNSTIKFAAGSPASYPQIADEQSRSVQQRSSNLASLSLNSGRDGFHEARILDGRTVSPLAAEAEREAVTGQS